MLPTQLHFTLQANCQGKSGAYVEHQDILSVSTAVLSNCDALASSVF
jgi:hypothetical protein